MEPVPSLEAMVPVRGIALHAAFDANSSHPASIFLRMILNLR
jgi:hypothetical protein